MAPESQYDFTESSYRKMIALAKGKGEFVSYQNHRTAEHAVLWRHDVDMSMHRALRLAEIEKEFAVASTYFVMLHSSFYNLFEREIATKLEKIAELGHHIGLHFDPGFYTGQLKSAEQLLECLSKERSTIENSFGFDVAAFSWHNPTVGDWLKFKDDTCAGMTNAYGAEIASSFSYVSDSNGSWRNRSIIDVLLGDEKKIHVLTHPEWWQAKVMTTRERVYRAVYGRAKSVMQLNDTLLKSSGREEAAGQVYALAFLKDTDASLHSFYDYLWNIGSFETLYSELCRKHKQQIIALCKLGLIRNWKIPIHEVNEFFEKSDTELNETQLFLAIFEITPTDVFGAFEPDYLEKYSTSNCRVTAMAEAESEEQRANCIYLSALIRGLAAWGVAEKSIESSGLAPISFSVEKSVVDAEQSDAIFLQKWLHVKAGRSLKNIGVA